MLYKIREVLWEQPTLISEFIADPNKSHQHKLDQEEIDLLQSWQTHHVKGMFALLKYTPEHAVFLHLGDIGNDKNGNNKNNSRGNNNSDASTTTNNDDNTSESTEPKLYGVKGMTTPISEAMSRKLPVTMETVLLPFKDKIVYDSFMISHNIDYGGGAAEMLDGFYAEAMSKHGIVTSLQDEG